MTDREAFVYDLAVETLENGGLPVIIVVEAETGPRLAWYAYEVRDEAHMFGIEKEELIDCMRTCGLHARTVIEDEDE